jgi:type IV pilus assembly protein PilW
MRTNTSDKQGIHAIRRTLGGFAGFTLVELMVGMVVGGLVATAIMGAYLTTANHIREQRDVAVMQMNQRGSIEDMELQIRMAGYDPEAPMPRNIFGITDVRSYTIQDEMTAPVLSAAGSPALTLVYDEYTTVAADGSLDANDSIISYRLMDENSDGRFELVRDVEPGDLSGLNLPREILAENIHAIGFAYAVDTDGDGNLDLSAGGNIIWAADTDNDNQLDLNLDTNGDGTINAADDRDSNDLFDVGDYNGGEIPAGISVPIALRDIRAVKIWLLARAEKTTDGYSALIADPNLRYVVGAQIIRPVAVVVNPANEIPENLKVRLLERTIECRNLGVTS